MAETSPLRRRMIEDMTVRNLSAFAEQAQGLDRTVTRQFVDQRSRLPVAAHQFARRRPGAGAGDEIILLGAQHARCPILRSVHGPLEFTGSGAPSASLSRSVQAGTRCIAAAL